jgi:hypothetical protein
MIVDNTLGGNPNGGFGGPYGRNPYFGGGYGGGYGYF